MKYPTLDFDQIASLHPAVPQLVVALPPLAARRSHHHAPRRMTMCLALLAAATIWSAAPASAGLYSVTGFTKSGTEVSFLKYYEVSTPDSAGIRREIISDFEPPTPYFPDYHLESAAASGLDGLGSRSFSRISKDIHDPFSHGTYEVSAQSQTTARYDDVFVSGTAGSIATSFRLSLQGVLGGEVGALYTYARSRVAVAIYINGSLVGGGFKQSVIFVPPDVVGPVTPMVTSDGVLSAWNKSGTITSPEFTVPANVAFTLEIQLSTLTVAQGFGRDPFLTTAFAEFGDGLRFTSSGGVFDLPAGYTVDSIDAGIVHNTYVIPEPASLGLLMAGGIGCLLLRRRQRVSNAKALKSEVERAVGHVPLLLMLTLVPSFAHGGETFTKIVDNSGDIDRFESTPTINNGGKVAIVVSYETSGLFDPIVETVLTGDGAKLTELYRNRGTVEYYGQTSIVQYLWGSSINASGTVAFRYTVNDTSYNAILTANADGVTQIADGAGAGSAFSQLGTPALNDAGTVAFWASVPGGSGIFVKNPGSPGGVIQQNGGSAYFGPVPDINAADTVAGEFHDASGVGFVITGMAGQAVNPIASTAVGSRDYQLFSPAINDRGIVAYAGLSRTDGSKSIYLQGTDGTTFLYATTATVGGVVSPFTSLGDRVAISDSGIAYYAKLSSPGNHGVIFRQRSLSEPLDSVVEIGDSLFGSTVTGFSTNPQINDNGEIVFLYTLASGVSGVAVASPGKLTRQISDGQSFGDTRLRSDQGSGNTASLRGGSASANRAVEMSFVPRDAAPPGAFASFVGDALSLTGTGDDVFVLQLSYTDADVAAAGIVDEAGLYIGWLDPVGQIGRNAVDGNTPPGGESFFGLSYDVYLATHGGQFRLGDYGNDPNGNTLWAVVNHNSLFVAASAAVPEPMTLPLLAMGMLPSLVRRRRQLGAIWSEAEK